MRPITERTWRERQADPEAVERLRLSGIPALQARLFANRGICDPQAARTYLNDFALVQANRIVSAFAGKFRHHPWKDIPQVSYPNMIRVLGGEPDWTVRQLRAKVMP